MIMRGVSDCEVEHRPRIYVVLSPIPGRHCLLWHFNLPTRTARVLMQSPGIKGD